MVECFAAFVGSAKEYIIVYAFAADISFRQHLPKLCDSEGAAMRVALIGSSLYAPFIIYRILAPIPKAILLRCSAPNFFSFCANFRPHT
jgi:hypothetical protein